MFANAAKQFVCKYLSCHHDTTDITTVLHIMLTLIWAILICIALITMITIRLPNEIWLIDVLALYHGTFDNICSDGSEQ